MNFHKTKEVIVLLVIVFMLDNDPISTQLIQEISSQLCPYTKFCQRTETENYNTLFRRPCCSKCSCEQNCWETASCCPDKNNIENREPVTKCVANIVKKSDFFGKAKWGYHIIDYCPTTEKNASLISKCTTNETRAFEELIWVSDHVTGNIYRNRFCAECHKVTINITEWSLQVKCTNDVYTSLGDLKSFYFSNKCQLTIIEPNNLTIESCLVPKYTTCNQTGLWQDFDADVNWACQAYEAVFIAKSLDDRGPIKYEAYRNVHCFVCNKDSIGNTATLCPLPSYDTLDTTKFISIIDYKRHEQRDDHDFTQATCRSYEVFDEIMLTCRVLKCPFGSSPVNGKCKSLFGETSGLYINIPLAMSVIWSRSEYKMSDTTKTLRLLGERIIEHIINEDRLDRNGSICPYCYLELKMAAHVYNQSIGVANNVSDADLKSSNLKKGVGNVIKELNEQDKLDEEPYIPIPAFILKAILFTSPECQLQNIFDIATDLFGQVIDIKIANETEMQLTVELSNENLHGNQTFQVIKKMKNKIWDCKTKGAHTLNDDKLCSKIAIMYNEFVPHLTSDNRDFILQFFHQKHIETGEPVDVCVDTYYERLRAIDFEPISEGSVITDMGTCMRFIILYGLRWLN